MIREREDKKEKREREKAAQTLSLSHLLLLYITYELGAQIGKRERERLRDLARKDFNYEVLVPMPLLFLFLLHEAQKWQTKGSRKTQGSSTTTNQGREERID